MTVHRKNVKVQPVYAWSNPQNQTDFKLLRMYSAIALFAGVFFMFAGTLYQSVFVTLISFFCFGYCIVMEKKQADVLIKDAVEKEENRRYR